MFGRALSAAFGFLKRTYARAQRSRLQMLAASLAYYAAFSLGPLLLLLGGWLAVVLERQPDLANDYRAALTHLVDQLLPLQVDAADLVANSFDLVVNELGQGAVLRTIVSLLVLLWASGNFFTSLQHALEAIFEVSDLRNFWRKRLVAVALVGAVVAVIGVEVVGDALVSAFRQLGGRLQGGSPRAAPACQSRCSLSNRCRVPGSPGYSSRCRRSPWRSAICRVASAPGGARWPAPPSAPWASA